MDRVFPLPMYQIKPLASLSNVEICALAHAAADRGETLHDANPFTLCQKPQREQFAAAFIERQGDLQPAI